jgi:shikimate dehydrogenase
MQNIVGLVGYPLSHSFSPNYFAQKWALQGITNWAYSVFEHQHIANAVEALKAINNLQGFNITIPHKQNILPYLYALTPAAQAIGAVNCVVVINNNWLGHNTDYVGFMQSFKTLLNPNAPLGKALILGNGGAAKAVFYALQQLGINYTIVEREPKNNNNLAYENLNSEIINAHKYIINTTPLGTFPNINNAPTIPYVSLTPNHIAYDLVYNPPETLFLQQCKQQGATIKNGSDMLKIQADESWKIWTS